MDNGKPKKNPKYKNYGENTNADKEKKEELFVFTGKELMPQSVNKSSPKPDVDPAPKKNLLANQTSATSLWMNSGSSPKSRSKKRCPNSRSDSSHQQIIRGPSLVPAPAPTPVHDSQLEEMAPIPLPRKQTQSESSWFSRFLDEEQKEKKLTQEKFESVLWKDLKSMQVADTNRARPPGRVCLPPKPLDYPSEDNFYTRNNFNRGEGIQPNIATFPSQEKMQFGDNPLYKSNINRQVQYNQQQHMNTLKSSKSTGRVSSEFYANVATITLDSNTNPSIRAPRIGPVPAPPPVERRPKMLVGAYNDPNFSSAVVQSEPLNIKNVRNSLIRSEDLNETKGLVQSLYLKELQEQILMKRKETEDRKRKEKEEEERIERKIKQDLEKMQNEYLQEIKTRKERPLKYSHDYENKRLYDFEYETNVEPIPAPAPVKENKVYSKALGSTAKKADSKPPVPPYSFSNRFLPPLPNNVSVQIPENSGSKTDLIKSLTSSLTRSTISNESTMKKFSKSKKSSPREENIFQPPMPTTETDLTDAAKADQAMKEEFLSGFKMALEREIIRIEQRMNLKSSAKLKT